MFMKNVLQSAIKYNPKLWKRWPFIKNPKVVVAAA